MFRLGKSMAHVVRLTEFTATQAAHRDALASLVREGQATIAAAPACTTCDTYIDRADPRKVVSIEVWTHLGARDPVAARIPAEVVRGAMALMDGAPESRDLVRAEHDVDAQGRPDGLRNRLRLTVIVASVREQRLGSAVAEWFLSLAHADERYVVDVIDLADIELPRALPADPADLMDPSRLPDALTGCSATLRAADAVAIVSPEYNHGVPASLKHFIDWHFTEWRAKPVACIGYGGLGGGVRAIESIRLILAELHATVIRDTVCLNAPWDHVEDGRFVPPKAADAAASLLLGRLQWWGEALRSARLKSTYGM